MQVVHEGDPVIGMKKGVNFLVRKGQVQQLAELRSCWISPGRLRGVNVQRQFGSGGL